MARYCKNLGGVLKRQNMRTSVRFARIFNTFCIFCRRRCQELTTVSAALACIQRSAAVEA